MDFSTLPVFSTLLDLAYAGLMALTTLLAPLAGPFAAALAIAFVTLVVRAALIPTGIAQAKAEQTRARLAPRLRDLQKRHRANPERLQRETMQLYRDEGASPFAGCLPMLIQAPIVGLLYSVFLHPTIGGHPNALLAESLFGVPLGERLTAAVATGSADPATWVVIGCLVLLIALVGELTRRLLRVPPLGEANTPQPRILGGLLGTLQFATAVVAMFVPLAAGIYLLVTVTWTLCQRLVLRRRYPIDG